MQHCCCAFTYDYSNDAETKRHAFGKMRFVFAISICMTPREQLQQQQAAKHNQHMATCGEHSTYKFVQDSKIICEYIKQHGIEAWRKLIG